MNPATRGHFQRWQTLKFRRFVDACNPATVKPFRGLNVRFVHRWQIFKLNYMLFIDVLKQAETARIIATVQHFRNVLAETVGNPDTAAHIANVEAQQVLKACSEVLSTRGIDSAQI